MSQSIPRTTPLGLAASAVLALSATAIQAEKPQPVALHCAISGLTTLRPAPSAATVCSAMQAELARALRRPVQVSAAAAKPAHGDWLHLALRFTRRGTASAMVSQRLHGIPQDHPEIAVDVMDKPLEMREVTLLAQAIARAVSAH